MEQKSHFQGEKQGLGMERTSGGLKTAFTVSNDGKKEAKGEGPAVKGGKLLPQEFVCRVIPTK